MKNDRAKLTTIITVAVTVTMLGACAAKPDDAALANQGAAALNAHKFDEGIALLQQSLKANPNNKDAHFQMARAYMETNQPQKAIEEADWLLKSGQLKDSAQLQNVFMLEGAAYVDLKNLQEAAKAFDNAAETQPPNPAAYEALGEVLYHDGQYKDAISAFDEATKLDPKDKRSFHLRAMSRLATGGNPELALPDLEKANALDPADAEIANDYVTNAEFFEKFRLALYILDLLKEYNPSADTKDTHDRMWKEAFAQAKQDHDKHPTAGVPYAYAAYLFMDNHDATSARQSVERGMQMKDGKEIPLLWRIKGDLAAADGKYEEALADYDTAIKVFVAPKDGTRDLGSQITHLHRDKVLKKLGRSS